MTAIVSSKRAALIICIMPVVGFGLGAWAQDVRMRDHYIEQGRLDANYDAVFDGYWLHLGCLRDDCSREREDSQFIVRRAKERIAGKATPLTMKDAKR